MRMERCSHVPANAPAEPRSVGPLDVLTGRELLLPPLLQPLQLQEPLLQLRGASARQLDA